MMMTTLVTEASQGRLWPDLPASHQAEITEKKETAFGPLESLADARL